MRNIITGKFHSYLSSDEDSCSTFIPSERLPLNLSSFTLLLLLRLRPPRDRDRLLSRDLLLRPLSLFEGKKMKSTLWRTKTLVNHVYTLQQEMKDSGNSLAQKERYIVVNMLKSLPNHLEVIPLIHMFYIIRMEESLYPAVSVPNFQITKGSKEGSGIWGKSLNEKVNKQQKKFGKKPKYSWSLNNRFEVHRSTYT